jgi:hypothetical protein
MYSYVEANEGFLIFRDTNDRELFRLHETIMRKLQAAGDRLNAKEGKQKEVANV